MFRTDAFKAAVIAVFHPKWQERPLACIAPLEQYRGDITKQEILDFREPHGVSLGEASGAGEAGGEQEEDEDAEHGASM